MWKMFSREAHAGSTAAFWDESWEESDNFIDGPDNDRNCENQGALWRLFSETLDRDRLFLEGGCGYAMWVRYYASRGYKAVGVDFAGRTVERVKNGAPYADVRLGDVTRLPLEDASVHTYYSGGVVEHFEEGPEAALREARRVLAKDGWFFCSVPDANTLRDGLLYPLQGDSPGATGKMVRKVTDTRAEAPLPDRRFYQYVFDKDEFTARLEATGFRVEGTLGMFLLWGLTEIPRVGPALQRLAQPRGRAATQAGTSTSEATRATATGAPEAERPVRRLLKRLALREDTSVPVLGAPLRMMLEHCSNMRLYIARPR